MTEDRYERPIGTTDDTLDDDFGVTDAPGGTENRPAGPDYADSPLTDETPGSQGEIEAGSEGDFAKPE